MIRFFLLLLLLFSSSSCKKEPVAHSRDLTLRVGAADMPVWVRGNPEGGRIILFLHGGPGECSYCLRPFFEGIEQNALMVYWDQRLAGSSRGNADPQAWSYAQHANDLRQLVLLLKQLYPEQSIWLFGHSFGVELGWEFLCTGNNAALVAGFVAMNGTSATLPWLKAVQQWVVREGAARGDSEAVAYFWPLVLTAQNAKQVVKWGEWYSRMFRVGANPQWPSDDPAFVRQMKFSSAHSSLSQLTNTAQQDRYYNDLIFGFDRSADLARLDMPIRLFWGVKDGIVPLETGLSTQALLQGNVPLVRFENSWHSAFHTENEKFTREMLKAIGL